MKILDNGVAERETVSPLSLMKWGEQIGATEIVVPDVMNDGKATRQACRDFTRWAEHNPGFKYVGVVQGQDIKDAIATLVFYAHMPWISTIAIPRCLANAHGPEARIEIYDTARIAFGLQHPIHFLGCSTYADEVVSLEESCPTARGIDTSMPFVFGLNKEILMRGSQYIERQPSYFHLSYTTEQLDYINSNIGTFHRWAGAYPDGAKASRS